VKVVFSWLCCHVARSKRSIFVCFTGSIDNDIIKGTFTLKGTFTGVYPIISDIASFGLHLRNVGRRAYVGMNEFLK
jgi:hypothetical protein